MTQRSQAQRRADAAYRERKAQVLLRLDPDEAELLDVARGDLTRPGYVRFVVRRSLGLMPNTKAEDVDAGED